MESNKLSALLAYLLFFFGWIYVFVSHKEDKLALYHTKQSIMIVLVAIGAPLLWLVVAWILMWIPFLGPVLAMSFFAFVIITYMALAVAWVTGMLYAWQAQTKPVPLVGKWGERLPIG